MGKVIKTILALTEITLTNTKWSHRTAKVCVTFYQVSSLPHKPQASSNSFHIPKMSGCSTTSFPSPSPSLISLPTYRHIHIDNLLYQERVSHFFLKEKKTRSYQMGTPFTPHGQVFPSFFSSFLPVSIAELSVSYPRPIS